MTVPLTFVSTHKTPSRELRTNWWVYEWAQRKLWRSAEIIQWVSNCQNTTSKREMKKIVYKDLIIKYISDMELTSICEWSNFVLGSWNVLLAKISMIRRKLSFPVVIYHNVFLHKKKHKKFVRKYKKYVASSTISDQMT